MTMAIVFASPRVETVFYVFVFTPATTALFMPMMPSAPTRMSRLRPGPPQDCRDCGLYRICFAPKLGVTGADGHPARLHRLTLRRGALLPTGSGVAIYAVRAGALRLEVQGSHGAAAVAGFRVPGEIIAVSGARPDLHWSALELTHLCALPARQLGAAMAHNADLPLAVARLLLEESETGLRRLRQAWRGSAAQRVAGLLLDLQRRCRAGARMRLPVSRRDMAAYLDLTLATVSRVLSQMQDRGLIWRRGRQLELRNLPALAALADSEAAPLPRVAGAAS
jgi:CRP/FNR family transcriptional regulator